MSRTSRRSASSGTEVTGLSGDALDRAAWESLSGVILAASHGDANAHAEVFRRRPGQATAEGRRASLYLWYLLRYRVAEVLGRRPSPEDLGDLAARTYPRFALLIRQDVGQLEATFQTVFESSSARYQPGGDSGTWRDYRAF